MLKWHQKSEGGIKENIKMLLILLVWLIGLVSTIYLVGTALYLTFLAVIFGMDTSHFAILGYLGFVGANSIPALCFALIGIAGLLFWPSARFWPFGLFAVLVETILALYIFANPESMLTFLEMFSK
jgi:hypothetical protein